MDGEERKILRQSLSAWCVRNANRLESMEKGSWDAASWERLYAELEELGVLHVLFDTPHDLTTVAEAANCLAAHSPSLALLVVQQNLAARLHGDAGADPPMGWVALPLYDSAAEWPQQVRVATTPILRTFKILSAREEGQLPSPAPTPARERVRVRAVGWAEQTSESVPSPLPSPAGIAGEEVLPNAGATSVAGNTRDRGYRVDGCWGSLSGLPIASSVLLPLASDDSEFALVRLDFTNLPAGVARGETARSLGLRGCPIADLTCTDAVFSGSAILACGAAAARSVAALWSQAEVLMLAIRAGILERSYSVARDYAAERWQGKKIIVEHSLVRRMLAELYGARCSVEESWRGMSAAVVADEPLTAGQLSMSLHFAAALPRLAADGIQLLGGYGYMEELGQERLFRDAKQCEMLLGHPQAKSFSIWQREPRCTAES